MAVMLAPRSGGSRSPAPSSRAAGLDGGDLMGGDGGNGIPRSSFMQVFLYTFP